MSASIEVRGVRMTAAAVEHMQETIEALRAQRDKAEDERDEARSALNRLFADALNCTVCGKEHQCRDISTGEQNLRGPILRFTWADPEDGHAYEHGALASAYDWIRAWRAEHVSPKADQS